MRIRSEDEGVTVTPVPALSVVILFSCRAVRVGAVCLVPAQRSPVYARARAEYSLFSSSSCPDENKTGFFTTTSSPTRDKRPRLESPHLSKRSKKNKQTPIESGSSEGIISREVVALLGKELVKEAEADGIEWESPFGFRRKLSSPSRASRSAVCLTPRFVQRPLLLTYPLVLYLTSTR